MSSGPDDRLTATRQLVAILSLTVRPNGKVNGILRDRGLLYRFTGLKGLGVAVNRWLTETLNAPAAIDPDGGPAEEDSSGSGPDEDEETAWH